MGLRQNESKSEMEREDVDGCTWYTGKTVACIAMCFMVVICSGSVHTFNAYSNSLKATFNFTQTSVEVIASSVAVGGCAHLLGGMALDQLGALWALILAVVLTTGGWILAWSTTWMVSFVHHRPLLLAFYLFIACHGRTYAYMAGLVEGAKACRPRHSVMILALLETTYDLGPLLLVVLYESAFVRGHVEDAENQDLGGFFLLQVILSMVANTIGALVIPATKTHDYHRNTKYETLPGNEHGDLGKNESNINVKRDIISSTIPLSTYSNTSEINNGGTDDANNCENNQKLFWRIRNVLQRQRDFIVRDSVILSPDYQLLLWGISLPLLVSTFVSLNITYLTHAMYLTQFDYIYVSLNRVFTIVGRASTVTCIFFYKRIPIDSYLIVGTASTCLCQFGMLVAPERGQIFLICSCGIAFAHGINYVLAPVIVLDRFGKESMGKNIGLIYTAVPIMLIILQVIFGASYRSMITDPDSIYCYGKKCIMNILIINQVLAIIGVILAVVTFVRKLKYLRTAKSNGNVETSAISTNGHVERELLIDKVTQHKTYLGLQ